MKYISKETEGLLHIISMLKLEMGDLEAQVDLWKKACDNLEKELKSVKNLQEAQKP